MGSDNISDLLSEQSNMSLSDVAYLRFVMSWPSEEKDKEDKAWAILQESKYTLEDEIRVTIKKYLGPKFELQSVSLSRGSIEVLVIINAIGAVYEFVSKYKDFVDSLETLKSQLSSLIRRRIDPQQNQPITLSGSWTLGSAAGQLRRGQVRNGIAQGFFYWCAGADEEVLSRCPRSEQIKQAGYGSLVIVPAILGFISMSYAIHTLTNERYKYLAIGVLWALVVFIFDRFIVSSFRKSDSIGRDLIAIPFLARFVFAVLIGIIIAHPLVLFIFEDSINRRLDAKQAAAITDINNRSDNDIGPLRNANNALNQALFNLETRKSEEIRQRETQLLERTRFRRRTSRTRELRTIRQRLINERDGQIKRINEQLHANEARIQVLQSERDNAVREYSEARDYPARESALDDLSAKNPKIGWTERLIILLFVFIDTLPITFKVMTKKAAYDVLLDSSNKRIIERTGKDDEVHTELVTKATEYRKRRIGEVVRLREGTPGFRPAVDDDFDTVVKESLFSDPFFLAVGGIPRANTSIAPLSAPPANATTNESEWLSKIKEKLKSKMRESLISIALIPVQAVLWFGWFMLSGTDILQYISSSAIFEAFALFVVNSLLTKMLKITSD
jgi:Domain of unknown function (DUF4407)